MWYISLLLTRSPPFRLSVCSYNSRRPNGRPAHPDLHSQSLPSWPPSDQQRASTSPNRFPTTFAAHHFVGTHSLTFRRDRRLVRRGQPILMLHNSDRHLRPAVQLPILDSAGVPRAAPACSSGAPQRRTSKLRAATERTKKLHLSYAKAERRVLRPLPAELCRDSRAGTWQRLHRLLLPKAAFSGIMCSSLIVV
jgi:hypothetical protein